MIIHKRGKNNEIDEMAREAEDAKNKKRDAMIEYMAALDYPEILPEEEEEEKNGK